MSNNLNTVLALAAGLIGGMLTRYIAPVTVSAQSQPPLEMRAQSFTLVDPTDRVIGSFTTEPSRGLAVPGPRDPAGLASARHIILRDSSGHVIWSTDGRVTPLSLK
jgi:hypothetical protein